MSTVLGPTGHDSNTESDDTKDTQDNHDKAKDDKSVEKSTACTCPGSAKSPMAADITRLSKEDCTCIQRQPSPPTPPRPTIHCLPVEISYLRALEPHFSSPNNVYIKHWKRKLRYQLAASSGLGWPNIDPTYSAGLSFATA